MDAEEALAWKQAFFKLKAAFRVNGLRGMQQFDEALFNDLCHGILREFNLTE